MSQQTLEAHYRPNWILSQVHGFLGYNCGYAEAPDCGSFAEHQQTLVWRLLGDTRIDGTTVVLDAGCGIGGPAGWIFERFKPRHLVAFDYCIPGVRTAEQRWRQQARRPCFLQADAHHLPVRDASVEVIFNLESALHYRDKRAFLKECRRALKPGGTLCLGDITTSRKWLFAPLQLLNRLPSQFNSNIHLWSAEDYGSALRAEGLRVLRQEDIGPHVATSLADGLSAIRRGGWAAARGVRGRCLFFTALAALFRSGYLAYSLFTAQRDGLPSTVSEKAASPAEPRP